MDAREAQRVPVRVPERRVRHAVARSARRGAPAHRAGSLLRLPARDQLGVPLRRREVVGHRHTRGYRQGQHQLLDHPRRFKS